MIMRPVDQDGDVLPVLVSASLLKGIRADQELVSDRLALLAGDWWENPSWGNAVIELLKENRYTETDQQALAAYLVSYIRETDGVLDVRDVSYSTEGRQFRYACVIETENGSAQIRYEV